jgi:hypothetical protein
MIYIKSPDSIFPSIRVHASVRISSGLVPWMRYISFATGLKKLWHQWPVTPIGGMLPGNAFSAKSPQRIRIMIFVVQHAGTLHNYLLPVYLRYLTSTQRSKMVSQRNRVHWINDTDVCHLSCGQVSTGMEIHEPTMSNYRKTIQSGRERSEYCRIQSISVRYLQQCPIKSNLDAFGFFVLADRYTETKSSVTTGQPIDVT